MVVAAPRLELRDADVERQTDHSVAGFVIGDVQRRSHFNDLTFLSKRLKLSL
jgi:hypothetical protein